ncbi:hypothetical protein ALLO2DRAFT_02469 [Frankia sp. Allo2]|jgi:hypothetical protein|nr:hypothetical protein BMG523Draft_00352 [Frankia sp. BMG5.23]KFB04747.1 hypothetical protein ALLO2DRAFT_02469 [Frankia sp. Allo2]
MILSAVIRGRVNPGPSEGDVVSDDRCGITVTLWPRPGGRAVELTHRRHIDTCRVNTAACPR